MAYDAPATQTTGDLITATIWNKLVNSILALRTGSIARASQAANDIYYASSATQDARLANGASGQVLTATASAAPSWAAPDRGICAGVLSLTSGVAFPTSYVTAGTTLYWVPIDSGKAGLYDGSAVWSVVEPGALSLTMVGLTASKPYDIFLDWNAGTPVLKALVWTDDTNRATAITTQDSVRVLTGQTDWRLVGTVYIDSGGGAVSDNATLMHVSNLYHQVQKVGFKVDSGTHIYTTATFRQFDGDTANEISFVVCIDERKTFAKFVCHWRNNTISSGANVGLGLDSTSARISACTSESMQQAVASYLSPLSSEGDFHTGVGRHRVVALQYSQAYGSATWFPAAGAVLEAGGLWVKVWQ